MDFSSLATLLLHDPRVQGVLIATVSKVVAESVNKFAKKPVSEEMRFWLNPVILILSAVTAGLNGAANGDLNVDPANVNNFLTVLVTSITTHLGMHEVGKAKAAVDAKKKGG